MTLKKITGGFATASLLLLAAVLPAGATSVYLEDFSTVQFGDTLATTAHWDTASGTLRLPPFELTFAGSIDTPGHARAVFINGTYAYVADRYSGLRIIDLSDPANPLLVGAYNTTGISYGVTVDGDYAYVTDDADGVHIIDVSNPASPSLTGSYDTPGYAYDVEISGNYAFVADYDQGGLQVLDVGDPANPVLAGSYDTPGSARGLILSGGYAFVADLTSGLQVFDISDPANPSLVGSYDTPGEARMVDVAGTYAYVADSGGGVQIIDVSDPSSPSLAGSYATTGWARDIAIDGDFLYVAVTNDGLLWLDISDPGAPAFLGSYDTPAVAHAVALTGGYAVVADYTSGLQVIDRAGQTGRNVAQSGVLPLPGFVVEMRVVPSQIGNVQWEASADGGANWQVMTGTGWTPMTHPGSSPMWRATLLYPPAGDYPVVDEVTIEAREAPVAVVVQAFEARSTDLGVELAWDIYADEEIAGFRIYRGSNGRTPGIVVNTAALIPAQIRSYTDTEVPGDGRTWSYALAAVKPDGTEVLSRTATVVTSVRAVVLDQNHPNPFNPVTTIPFVLPERTGVDLSVYNMRGQLVKTLIDRVLDAGNRSVMWDGTDASGNPVASGVYFYRLRSGNDIQTRKMILLK